MKLDIHNLEAYDTASYRMSSSAIKQSHYRENTRPSAAIKANRTFNKKPRISIGTVETKYDKIGRLMLIERF